MLKFPDYKSNNQVDQMKPKSKYQSKTQTCLIYQDFQSFLRFIESESATSKLLKIKTL